MQSFLQYRRFGKTVRAQYERDQEKAVALTQHRQRPLSSDSSALSTPPTDPSSAGIRDLEKGENGDGIGQGGINAEPEPRVPSSEADTPGHELEQPDMSRMRTAATEKSLGTNLGMALTGIEVRHRTTREGGDHGKVFVVGYEGENDSMNPHNWSFSTRIFAT